ncbi:hypothetical protein BDV26DRAFT_302789 [Aspergillus bertholletiae]|uniref:Uncharacterized protein n=1 Tax=Aspergillus bertholletiae TaxID=1226010 RepID=A0A5N7ANI1_9EURO|nr:hypothetical protein BDV26DRAFT_302789 [Aspergillus bertholletiae]
MQQGQVSTEPGLCRRNSGLAIETRYIQMLLELDYIPWFYNVFASAGHWVLLAGYLVIPGTFTSLQKSKALNESLENNNVGHAILKSIQNPPLLGISCFLLVLGSILMAWLAWERRNNYIWLISRLFIPTFLNALAGLITTLVNIYTAQSGDWSIMALLTVIATGLSMVSSLALIIIYKFVKLERVKQEHEIELNARFQRVLPHR